MENIDVREERMVPVSPFSQEIFFPAVDFRLACVGWVGLGPVGDIGYQAVEDAVERVLLEACFSEASNMDLFEAATSARIRRWFGSFDHSEHC